MEQTAKVILYVERRNSTAVSYEQLITLRENVLEGPACIVPFIDKLLEHSGIGVLRDEAHPQHLDSLPRNFFHDGRIVQKPPATEWQQVVELARVNAKLVLIFPAEHTNKKPVFGKIPAKICKRC